MTGITPTGLSGITPFLRTVRWRRGVARALVGVPVAGTMDFRLPTVLTETIKACLRRFMFTIMVVPCVFWTNSLIMIHRTTPFCPTSCALALAVGRFLLPHVLKTRNRRNRGGKALEQLTTNEIYVVCPRRCARKLVAISGCLKIMPHYISLLFVCRFVCYLNCCVIFVVFCVVLFHIL